MALLPRSSSGAPVALRWLVAALQVRSVQGVQAVPAEVNDLAKDLAEVAAGDLADVEEDDLAGGGSVRGDGLELLDQGLEFLDGGLEGDPDLVVELEGVVDDDDLAKVTSQGGLESGLLRCCQPCRCRSVAGLAVTDLLSF